MHEKRIYIIGMAGSGKTTIGKMLAEKLGYKFLDMNTEIEKEALMFYDEIVGHYGFQTISNAETNLLKKFTDEKLVIACNDAVVLNRDNKKLLNGFVFYLDVDNKVLEKRLENEYPKIAYESMSVEEIAQSRFLKYRDFSTHIINNNQNNIEHVVNEMIEILQLK